MARYIITLQALGKELAWMLLQQARGIPEAKFKDDFLDEKTFVLLFARPDLSERLCITAAIRQMSGHTVYMGPEEHWTESVSQFPRALLGSISYYMDGVIVHGLPTSSWMPEGNCIQFPVLNCGNMESHPAHALADIACMMRYSGDDLRKVRLAWIGAPTGALFSLMEATAYFPFAIQVALPQNAANIIIQEQAAKLKTDITFHETPVDAVQGCQFVMAGSSGQGRLSYEAVQAWSLNSDIMARAESDAHVLLGTNPMNCIPIEPAVLENRNSLVLLQSENRLRVYKRMLHWLCEDY